MGTRFSPRIRLNASSFAGGRRQAGGGKKKGPSSEESDFERKYADFIDVREGEV